VPTDEQEKGLTDSGMYALFDTDRSSKEVVGENAANKICYVSTLNTLYIVNRCI